MKMSQENSAQIRPFAEAGSIKSPVCRQVLRIGAVLVLALVSMHGFGQAASSVSLGKAASVIENPQNAVSILKFLHLGAAYRGLDYLETDRVIDNSGQAVNGEAALVYRFHWQDDDHTDVAFFVNQAGQIYQTKILNTSAVLSQPFFYADLSIQLVGRILVNADDKMTVQDRQQALKLIDKADAHGLMDLWLALESL